MDLSIIIPTYDRTAVITVNLPPLIELIEQSKSEIEVIIVNDFKPDNDREPIINSNYITYLNNQKQGVSSARNLGAKIAKSHNLLFMDDDILAIGNCIDEVITFLHASAPLTTLNCDWTYPENLNKKLLSTSFGRSYIKYHLNELRGWMGPNSIWRPNSLIINVTAASYFLAMTKKTFDLTGGYNEIFKYAGFEDGEFASRLKLIGVNSILDTRFKVYHNEFDRIELSKWLERKRSEGFTRKTSVILGNTNYEITPNSLKAIIFDISYSARYILLKFVAIMDGRLSDRILHTIIKLLEGSYTWVGYKQKQ